MKKKSPKKKKISELESARALKPETIKPKPKPVEAKPKPEKVKTEPKPETTKILGTVANYRLGMRSQHDKEFLIRIPNVESYGEASKYIGRRAVWQSEGGKKIVGKVLGVHGRNGILRAKFRKGLPGQAIGTNVEII